MAQPANSADISLAPPTNIGPTPVQGRDKRAALN
jgi:hypothetical protein